MSWLKLIRLYYPAGLVATLSLAFAIVVHPLGDKSLTRGFYEVAMWLPTAGLAFAFIHGLWTLHRCCQAGLGTGPICPYCGGPLGAEKSGKYSLHRTCMACGKHANERHYR
jgi:hypothetical protein